MNTRRESDGFQNRLLAELKDVVANRSVAPSQTATAGSSHRFRMRLGMSLAVAVAMAATLAVLVGPATTPAYAVTSQSDGTVLVEINHLSDAAGLRAKLDAAGIPSRVDYLPSGTICREPRFQTVAATDELIVFAAGSDGSLAFYVDPADVTGDRTLVIVLSGPKEGPPDEGTQVFVAVAQGAVGDCEPVPANATDS